MNKNLNNAKRAKNDEFYTKMRDIEKEMAHYEDFFACKSIYCNADNFAKSNFVLYFDENFERLGLSKLVATNFRKGDDKAFCFTRTSDTKTVTQLKRDGDFRSEECISLLKEADIVVTNPPFSLFREYVAQLIEHDKKFLIIGNYNAITYKGFFPLLKDDKVWIGHTNVKEFLQPDGSTKKVNATWYTNLNHKKRHEELILFRSIKKDAHLYQKYDNYDAINVDKVMDIPYDYDGVMGVPITFMDKYNPEQFEIVAFRKGDDGKDLVFTRERERESSMQ